MSILRLDKLLADTGRWSRSEAKKLVRQGCVKVNGRTASSPDEKYNPEGLSLTVDGEEISCRKYTYLMMNKPEGVLSATEDRRQKTILDLLPPELQRRNLFPVGRLDKDSTGLILLTNHGELAHRLLSPRYHVDKVYLVRTDGEINEGDVEAFEHGMTLGDGEVCLPAGLEKIEGEPGWCTVILHEGKFHQVKRMLAARGKPVLSLKRISMGNLSLDDALLEGEYRDLNAEEEENLLLSVQLKNV